MDRALLSIPCIRGDNSDSGERIYTIQHCYVIHIVSMCIPAHATKKGGRGFHKSASSFS